jgi:hypothetical protein
MNRGTIALVTGGILALAMAAWFILTVFVN